MKVFLDPLPAALSQGIHRVARAMHAHLPASHVKVRTLDEAEFAVFHIIGWGSLEGAVGRYIKSGRPYAVVQYCLRSSENPDPGAWYKDCWHGAAQVWSYYNIPDYCEREWNMHYFDRSKFFFAPMGVNPNVFTPRREPGEPDQRPYAVFTSGYIADTESVTECAQATAYLRQTQFHLGPSLRLGPHVHALSGISDRHLAACYRACRFVAGLRRIEGFEMPALEGLLCGAIPVLFDKPWYRDWFGDHGIYVPEVAPEELVPLLVSIFESTTWTPLAEEKRLEIVKQFSWATLCPEWWARIEQVLHGR